MQLQIERLQSTLNRVYRNVAFYKNAFDESRIDIEKIKSIADIRRLPFTTKEDLRKSYPYNMFAVPLRDIVRIHSTAGRTGRPIAIGYTRNDILNWSEQVARVLAAAGVTDNDFVQIAFDYNMFTGGLGLHYGAEKLGASVIPSSQSGDVQREIHMMKDYKTTVLLSTPGYALRVAGNLKEMGIHPEELNLKMGLFGAEPWGDATRSRIEEKPPPLGVQHLRRQRDDGPGRVGRMRRKERPSHQRGPLYRRDRRPGHAASRCRHGRRGRAGHHHHHAGGVPPDPLPHRRHLVDHGGGLSLRPHDAAHGARVRRGRTTCSW